jgi:hypothetical protein
MWSNIDNPRLACGMLTILMLLSFSAAAAAVPLDQSSSADPAEISTIELLDRRSTTGLVLQDDLELTVRVIQERRSDIALDLRGTVRSNRRSAVPALETGISGSTLRAELTQNKRVQLLLRISGRAELILRIPVSWRGALNLTVGSARIELGSLELPVLECRSSSGSISADTLAGDSLLLRSSSGAIEVAEISCERSNLRTSSGSLRVNRAAGHVQAESSSGNVHVDFGSRAGEILAESSSGGLTVLNLNGRASLESSSGNVRFSAADVREEISVKTASGNVRGVLSERAAFDLAVKTSSGAIAVGFPVTMKRAAEDDRVEGTVGGGGQPVRITTSSGNVNVSP